MFSDSSLSFTSKPRSHCGNTQIFLTTDFELSPLTMEAVISCGVVEFFVSYHLRIAWVQLDLGILSSPRKVLTKKLSSNENFLFLASSGNLYWVSQKKYRRLINNRTKVFCFILFSIQNFFYFGSSIFLLRF